jgi:LPXTG-motif cell wall-anchored protein
MSRASFHRLATGSLLGLVLAGTALVTAPAAVAADLPAPTASKTTVGAGEEFSLSGSGCLEVDQDNGVQPWSGIGSPAQLNGEYFSAVKPDGTWTMPVWFEKGTPDGTYQVVMSCDSYDHQRAYAPITLTVGQAAPAVPAVPAAPAAPAACGAKCQMVAPGATLTPDKAVAPGEKRNLAFYGFQPFEVVKLVLHSTPRDLGTFTADANGIVVVAFEAPAGTEAGNHTLKLTRADGTVVEYAIKIASGKRLADTGADVTVPLALGGAMLLAGGGALLVARRRNAGAPQV